MNVEAVACCNFENTSVKLVGKTIRASAGACGGAYTFCNGSDNKRYRRNFTATGLECGYTDSEISDDCAGDTAIHLISRESEASLVARLASALASMGYESGTEEISALRYVQNLTDDDGEYANSAELSRAQWHISHPPTPTCYLKVWIYSSFVGDGGGAPAVTLEGTYEWEGTGTPCGEIPGPEIQGDDTELFEPATSGTISLSMKYSFLRAYEPDISDPDNPQPNGFPDPTWEPAAP